MHNSSVCLTLHFNLGPGDSQLSVKHPKRGKALQGHMLDLNTDGLEMLKTKLGKKLLSIRSAHWPFLIPRRANCFPPASLC